MDNFEESTVNLGGINKGNDEFYSIEYILSKKYPKNFVRMFKKRENYKFDTFELTDVVFDMSEIGKDPIGLIRSILIQYDYSLPIFTGYNACQRQAYSIIDEYFPEISKELKTNKISDDAYKAGIIYLLSIHPDKKIVYKLTMNMLCIFLGAKYMVNNEKNQRIYDPYLILGEPKKMTFLTFDKAIEKYHTDLDEIILYLNEAFQKLESKKANDIKNEEEKENVLFFLRKLCGFKENEIDYFVSKAWQDRIALKLKQFYIIPNTTIMNCIPKHLQGNLSNTLRLHMTHPYAKTMECPGCWLHKHNLPKCKIHTNGQRTMGHILNEIAIKSQPLPQEDTYQPLPSAPPKDEEKESKALCDVCMERNKSHALVPCGHCYCIGCIKKIDKCPECRGSFQSTLKIFI